MTDTTVRVAANGYGVIGKRVADADVVSDYQIRVAVERGYPIYASVPERQAEGDLESADRAEGKTDDPDDGRGCHQSSGLDWVPPVSYAPSMPKDAPLGANPRADQRPCVSVLPDGIAACLFDLDGVLTKTAKVHAAAWKGMFDAFLHERSRQTGEPDLPFEIVSDYPTYVDGKLRKDGIRAFLASRGIMLSEGSSDDPPTAQTVSGLGRRKNERFLDLLQHHGVEVYDGSVRFVEAVRDAGLRRAVVSASKNCRAILAAAGIAHLFEVRVDGIVAAKAGLRGKPAPDTFLAAAAALGVAPARCAVFEDAIAGVEAGRVGAFGWVVGVDRVGQAAALRRHGANTVVGDLSELLEEQ